MAELTPLYMDISGVYSGDELGLPYRDIMSEGVVGANDLLVAQRASGANLSVDVAAGAAWVLGDTDTNAQPCYRVRNDAVVNKGITPDPSNPRKVIIVAQVTDATFSGATRVWAVTAIHGTPAASPVEPALPASALKLAVITVPAAAASIVNANIADARVRATVGGGQAIPGGAFSGVSVFHSANVSLPNGATTTLPWNSEAFDTDAYHDTVTNPSRLTVPAGKAGTFRIRLMLDVQTGATAALDTIEILKNGAAVRTKRNHPEAGAYGVAIEAVIPLAVGDYVEAAYVNANAASHTATGSSTSSVFGIERLG